MDTRLTPLEKTENAINIAAEVGRLAKMTVPGLRARHEELFGEVAKSHHRDFLARQIAWRLQAESEGGLAGGDPATCAGRRSGCSVENQN